MFYFRLAYTLKITLTQAFNLPRWEVEAWRALFDVYGPLDWKRGDYLNASLIQSQCSERLPIREFILFTDPSVRIDPDAARAEREQNLLAAFGYRKDDNERG